MIKYLLVFYAGFMFGLLIFSLFSVVRRCDDASRN